MLFSKEHIALKNTVTRIIDEDMVDKWSMDSSEKSPASVPEDQKSDSATGFFEGLSEFFKNNDAKDIEVLGCVPSARALALAHGLKNTPNNPLLVIAKSSREAQIFFNNLEFFSKGVSSFRPLYFPSEDLSPYVPSSPNIAVTAKRLECLYYLATMSERPMEQLILVAPIGAMAERVIEKETLLRGCLRITAGDEIDRELLVEHLQEVGYVKSQLVEDQGQFAIRGAIVDIYPPLMKHPLRFEFFGDDVETIRTFNPETQRTRRQKDEEEGLQEVLILPVREIYQDEISIKRAQNQIKRRMDDIGISKAERERINEMVRNHIYFPGIEHYLPLFRKGLVSPASYFSGTKPIQVLLEPEEILSRFFNIQKEIWRCFEEAQEEEHPTSIVGPEERFVTIPEDEIEKVKALVPFWLGEGRDSWRTLRFESLDILDSNQASSKSSQSLRVVSKSHGDLRKQMELSHSGVGEPLKPLLDLLEEYNSRGFQTVIVCGRKTLCKRLLESLNLHEVEVQFHENSEKFFKDEFFSSVTPRKSSVRLIMGQLTGGFLLPGKSLAVISEEDIFGPRVRRKGLQPKERSENSRNLNLISAFSELTAGDFVVHLDFGIARYLGLERMNLGGVENDFLSLEYKGNDKLFLPIHRLSRIQKYVGGEAENIALDRLGNKTRWESVKSKVKRKIQEVAKELLHLYATRQVAKGHQFSRPNDYYHEFEAEFSFEETPDQAASINEVLGDLNSAKPMDRLICGDVGFGKTEVAIRGIFLVAMEGYQTALLAPTTVLVHQHYQTFKKRFEGYPIKVAMLSRFSSRKEILETLENIKQGKVDVVVGTHRLLSSDVQFKKLGFLVIDEEQRFGVRHKERLKMLRKNVDVLTMSATPIPRTLNLSMIGVRDLSVINTPPIDRVSIRTMICEFDDRVIREGILREIQRGGQVYFLHNRVQTIQNMANYLRSLVPEAKLAVAHGQMNELDLEKIMVKFVDHQYDILLCTTIIESGLDIPLVNTIMVNHADKFGLSQLYQLRGRVGRSNRRAYAYLLIAGRYLISEKAKKRLEVLQRYTELGSGFRVASHDMEIRGAGNLLGGDQSGHIKNVGLELYASLMNKAIKELKGEKIEDEIDPEIDLRIPAFIPEDYIPEDNLRLGTYKRLSMLMLPEEVEEMELELQDRFGSLPREVQNLLRVIEIKVMAKTAFITKLVFGGSSATVNFDERTPVDVNHLLHLVNTHKGWRLLPDNRLVIRYPQNKDGTIPIDREARVLKETKAVIEKLLQTPN